MKTAFNQSFIQPVAKQSSTHPTSRQTIIYPSNQPLFIHPMTCQSIIYPSKQPSVNQSFLQPTSHKSIHLSIHPLRNAD